MSAFASSFIVSFDEFYLAFFLSRSDQTLPVYFFSGLRRAQLLPPTVALSTIVMVVTVVAITFIEVYRPAAARSSSLHREPPDVTDPASRPAVGLDGVRKTYGDAVAVRDLSLEIGRGEFFTLLGPSGCGKTTTLRMIGGSSSRTAGASWAF